MEKGKDKPRDELYRWSEVLRIANEMRDITHGLTTRQKDGYAEYLKWLAEESIKEKAK